MEVPSLRGRETDGLRNVVSRSCGLRGWYGGKSKVVEAREAFIRGRYLWTELKEARMDVWGDEVQCVVREEALHVVLSICTS